MKKIILLSMLVAGLSYADAQHTWKMAQEFNNSVLKEIKDDWGRNPCYIYSVHERFFSVACEPEKFIFELPYTWKSWKIEYDSQARGFAIYSNE